MNIPISKVKKEVGFRINVIDIIFIGLSSLFQAVLIGLAVRSDGYRGVFGGK